MGFTTGFTGGVAVTLSVAYLSVLAHQRNREYQSASLRAQALALSSLVDPLPAPLPPTRSEVAIAQRQKTVEVAKDRWNHEVENAVRWVQHTDWTEVREGMEENASRLWYKATGETPEEEVERLKRKAEKDALILKNKAEEGAAGVAMAAKDAYETAKAEGISAEATLENKFAEGQLAIRETLAQASEIVQDTAVEASNMAASAFEKSKEAAQDFATRAKAAAHTVEDKAQSVLATTATPTLDPVQRALQQRYQRPEAKVNRTVTEALRERYTPMDNRDNTVLRGV